MSKQWQERYPEENMTLETYKFMEGTMSYLQQQENQEHEEKVEELLLESVKFLDKDQFKLLCYLAGKSSNDYQTMPTKETA